MIERHAQFVVTFDGIHHQDVYSILNSNLDQECVFVKVDIHIVD